MSKRDYELIASSIRIARGETPEDDSPDYIAGRVEGCDAVARELASSLAETNSRFDEATFLAACGVPA